MNDGISKEPTSPPFRIPDDLSDMRAPSLDQRSNAKWWKMSTAVAAMIALVLALERGCNTATDSDPAELQKQKEHGLRNEVAEINRCMMQVIDDRQQPADVRLANLERLHGRLDLLERLHADMLRRDAHLRDRLQKARTELDLAQGILKQKNQRAPGN